MESIAEAVPKDIDPYKTLNLISTASADEIKSAYKKLALRHHPGTNTIPSPHHSLPSLIVESVSHLHRTSD